ncbi:hypothetical protein ACFSWE_11355 [Leucobacter albus]|uniref:Phospholipase D-like protein n=1 Tax=Leucobacter albus TaxID=272210 RepID=A0ABW3TQ92_9MICO
MDQNQRWEQLARLNETAPPPAPRGVPVFGRAALAVGLLALVLFFIVPATSFKLGETWINTKQIVFGVVAIAAVALAVASFVRKERRALGVVALSLVIGAPLIIWVVVILAWAGYARSLGG